MKQEHKRKRKVSDPSFVCRGCGKRQTESHLLRYARGDEDEVVQFFAIEICPPRRKPIHRSWIGWWTMCHRNCCGKRRVSSRNIDMNQMWCGFCRRMSPIFVGRDGKSRLTCCRRQPAGNLRRRKDQNQSDAARKMTEQLYAVDAEQLARILGLDRETLELFIATSDHPDDCHCAACFEWWRKMGEDNDDEAQ